MFTKTARLIVVLALIATGAFAQIIRPADLQRAEQMRAHMQVRTFRPGDVVPHDSVATAPTQQAVSSRLYTWADKLYYLPGENLQVRSMGIAPDAQNLQFFIEETFIDWQGNASFVPSHPCDCGGANGGFVSSLTGFNFITLIEKKVPWALGGRYDFTISAYQFIGSTGIEQLYQQSRVIVNIGFSATQIDSPIRVDSMTVGLGQGPVIFLTGKFPANVPMYYMVGTVPYEMVFTDQPEAVSTDGNTLVLPGLYNGLGMEGRVVLMMPDGRFSMTSPQTFVTLPVQANSAIHQ